MHGLVVDPSPTQQRILSNVLQRAGCEEIEVAGNLAQGLAALTEEADTRFDFVIVERDLPDGNGLDVIRKYREHDAETAGTAVLVTVRNARRDVMEALQAGVDAYVLKPLSPDALLERLEATVASRQPDVQDEPESRAA